MTKWFRLVWNSQDILHILQPFFLGVEHVVGNVLESIPAGDAIFMKVCVT